MASSIKCSSSFFVTNTAGMDGLMLLMRLSVSRHVSPGLFSSKDTWAYAALLTASAASFPLFTVLSLSSDGLFHQMFFFLFRGQHRRNGRIDALDDAECF